MARLGGGAATGLALALVLAGCGGGDGSGPPSPAPTLAPPSAGPPADPAASLAADNAVVQRTLAIDLGNLADYASPALPTYYDASVIALDNSPPGGASGPALATLGRVLFYDSALSVNDTVACASCHRQAIGFGDDRRFGTGHAGVAFTDAHGMRLGNLRYWKPGTMFWNRRTASVEAQASVPILNMVEMGWQQNGGFPALAAKLAGRDYYPVLFRRAFGDAAIGEARIQQALASFQRAIVSADSRWDRAYAQVFSASVPGRGLDQALPGFSASEQRGRQLFMTAPAAGGAGCSACHLPPTFALAGDSRGNGLDAGETTVFKAASLKNVGRAAFFMHDGRFGSLAQVVNFYSTGVQDGPALDDRLRAGGQPLRLNLSAEDRQALVDFLLTLNDETLVADRRFADPFIR